MDSLAAWEEAAEKVQGKKYDYLSIVAINYNPLILKTQEAIGSYYDETKDASKVSHGAHSLKNTTQRKALTTALQMVNSHSVWSFVASPEQG